MITIFRLGVVKVTAPDYRVEKSPVNVPYLVAFLESTKGKEYTGLHHIGFEVDKLADTGAPRSM